jgi:RNA polymerase II-associated factor 1
VYIKAQVERNFQIAAEKLAEPRRLVHPTKPHLKLLSTFPLIPDLAAFPDFGGYISVKFQHNPVPPSNVYDTRLESSLLRLIPLPQERADARDAAVALAEADPEHYSFPEPDQNFEFYLLDTPEESKKYKRKCDVLDPERDDDDLYTYEGTLKDQPHKSFRFNRVREYETASSVAPEQGDKYGDEVAIALNDGKDRKHQRAAYYYPIVQRQQIRPQRRKNMEAKFSGLTKEEEETMVDIVDLVVEEPTEVEATRRQAWVDDPEYGPEEDAEETLPAGTQPSAGQEARESEVDIDDDESEG